MDTYPNTGGGGGSVDSVTASSPLVSSGGTNPNITLNPANITTLTGLQVATGGVEIFSGGGSITGTHQFAQNTGGGTLTLPLASANDGKYIFVTCSDSGGVTVATSGGDAMTTPTNASVSSYSLDGGATLILRARGSANVWACRGYHTPVLDTVNGGTGLSSVGGAGAVPTSNGSAFVLEQLYGSGSTIYNTSATFNLTNSATVGIYADIQAAGGDIDFFLPDVNTVPVGRIFAFIRRGGGGSYVRIKPFSGQAIDDAVNEEIDLFFASDNLVLMAVNSSTSAWVTISTYRNLFNNGLNVSEGGTGVNFLTAHGVLIGNNTGGVNVTGTGTAGQVFTSNGTSDPTFQNAGGGGQVGYGTTQPNVMPQTSLVQPYNGIKPLTPPVATIQYTNTNAQQGLPIAITTAPLTGLLTDGTLIYGFEGTTNVVDILGPPVYNSNPGQTLSGVISSVNPQGACWVPGGEIWVGDSGTNLVNVLINGGVTVASYTLNTGTVTQDLTCGSDGNVYLLDSANGTMIQIDSTTGSILNTYPLPAVTSGPAGTICTCIDGRIAFVNQTANTIVFMTTAGVFTSYTCPTPSAVLSGICADPNGGVYFTEANNSAGVIGHCSFTGSIVEYPTVSTSARPAGICMLANGNVAYVEGGNNAVGIMLPFPNGQQQIEIQTGGSGAGGLICIGPEGAIYSAWASVICIIPQALFIGSLGLASPVFNAVGTAGSTNSVWYTSPFWGPSYKKIIVYLYSYTGSGVTIDFPTGMGYIGAITANSTNISASLNSPTAPSTITLGSSVSQTGVITIEGY